MRSDIFDGHALLDVPIMNPLTKERTPTPMIVFLDVGYDESAEDPFEWGSQGELVHGVGGQKHSDPHRVQRIHAFRGRSLSESSFDSVDEWRAAFKRGELDVREYAVPVSYYEHGTSHWAVKGQHNFPDMRWDGVGHAGYWIPTRDMVESAVRYAEDNEDATIDSRLRDLAAGVMKTYTKWCNGWVYGYQYEGFKPMRDDDGTLIESKSHYRHLDVDDGCWGFFDEDYMLDVIRETLHCEDMPPESRERLDDLLDEVFAYG